MVTGSKECRVYLLDTKSAGGDESPDAAVSDAPALQRRGRLPVRRHLGQHGKLGRCEGYALGPDSRSGDPCIPTSKFPFPMVP